VKGVELITIALLLAVFAVLSIMFGYDSRPSEHER
jgi:hypothetical protein